MICRACRVDYPGTDEHWYMRDGKRDGRICIHCRRHAVPICQHCKQPIEGRTAQAKYHIDDNHPACKQAQRLHHLHSMRRWDRAHQAERKAKALQAKKPITVRLCKRCKKNKVRKGNYFFCEKCWGLCDAINEDFWGV